MASVLVSLKLNKKNNISVNIVLSWKALNLCVLNAYQIQMEQDNKIRVVCMYEWNTWLCQLCYPLITDDILSGLNLPYAVWVELT